ncbi:siderophore-interacting protein [Xanthobacter sp. TB0136]|uniref:siderophore-interacting protein n=1 Tax=Xanthobacter sp. TB0136 TaxID=3459177 RepID=UPI0040399C6A
MGGSRGESVEDRQGLLAQDDHMRDMERIQMEVVSITRPTPTVARVTARIAPTNPDAWCRPNLAMRIEVETPEDARPVSRVYTVRSFDPERSTIEIDFVVHPDDSPAMRWLAQAGPGTKTWFVGPRPHFLPDYECGRKIAIFADETAIPAVYAILNAWEQPARGVVYVETTDRAAFEELPQVPGVENHLFLRGEDEQPGKTPYLLDAAQALPEPGAWSIWAAGEREVARAIRKYFEGHGLGRDEMRVFGYWRHGVSSSQIDRARLGHYSGIRARGEGLERFEDLDLPV